MSEDSVKARRHARKIRKAAERRASTDVCYPGTDKVMPNGLRRAAIIENRRVQESKIIAKRIARQKFAKLSPAEKIAHREAGRDHKIPADLLRVR